MSLDFLPVFQHDSQPGRLGGHFRRDGGYLLPHWNRRVTVLLFRLVTDVSGFVAVGIWFLFQLISGMGMLGGMETGVAYRARSWRGQHYG